MKKFYLCYKTYNLLTKKVIPKSIKEKIRKIAEEYGFKVIEYKFNHKFGDHPDAYISEIFPIEGVYDYSQIAKFFREYKEKHSTD